MVEKRDEIQRGKRPGRSSLPASLEAAPEGLRWPRRLFSCSLAYPDAQAGAEVERQADVTDGRDVLVAGQVFRLAVEGDPGNPLVAAADVDVGIAVVEVPVGQEQAVAAVEVFILQES